jgi:signal transduction histidine kinase
MVRGYLAAGLGLTALYFAFPAGGSVQTAIYTLLGVAAAVVLLATRRRPWMLLGVGIACFVAGDLLSTYHPTHVMDGFYLAGYPLLTAGLLWLLLASARRNRLAALADAGIVLFAFAVFQWLFVLQSTVGYGWVASAYPVMDIVLLGGFAGFFLSPAWRTPVFWLLLGAVALQLLGDEIYLRSSTYTDGSWIDAFWLASYALLGAAALHRSRDALAEPRRLPTLRVSFGRIALLAAALLTVPAAVLIQALRGDRLGWVVAVFGAAIALLVVARLTGILRALEAIRLRERQARALAEQANEQLLAADRMKDEFVALISHDLRTPLTSIIGYVELALDDVGPELDEERRSYLEVVSRSSERLLRIVDDLLFVARLQAGNLTVARRRLDLCSVAAQSVEEARPRAEAKRLALSFLSSGPVFVDADRGRIFQLLDNLISNAMKFTPEGGRIDVRVVAARDTAVLEVSDTGVGLGHDTERVFDRFFRTPSAEAGQVPGTGLGLFIARAIVEAHDGRITAANREQGGATFRIELPPSETQAELVA